MPLYDFVCLSCRHEMEKFIKLKSKNPKCPECGKRMVKAVSATTFILSGKNWERDGYGLRAQKKSPKKGDK
jgi:putative FmdB family regulatory protein